jgi:hypothetical protein
MLILWSTPSYRLSLYRLGTDLQKPHVTCRNAWGGPHRKHHFLHCCEGMFTALLPINRNPVVACTFVVGMRLPSRCLAMGIQVTVLFGWTSGYKVSMHIAELFCLSLQSVCSFCWRNTSYLTSSCWHVDHCLRLQLRFSANFSLHQFY